MDSTEDIVSIATIIIIPTFIYLSPPLMCYIFYKRTKDHIVIMD